MPTFQSSPLNPAISWLFLGYFLVLFAERVQSLARICRTSFAALYRTGFDGFVVTDWEGDTVVGKGGGACLVTLVDRTSRLLEGGRSEAHTKDEVGKTEVAALAGHPETETITLDRGKEFAGFAEVERAVGAVTYFALPHHPWQRGTNENTNGLLREYFPKGTDFAEVTDEEVRSVYDEINKRPRKCLGYLTPYEVHYSETLQLL